MDSREEGGRKSEIPTTFGPIHVVFEPYFAVSLPIVFHVNLLHLHNKIRAARSEAERLKQHREAPTPQSI